MKAEKSKPLDDLICLVCKRQCLSKSGLSRHLSIHKLPENYILCEKCGACLRNEGKYKAHLKTHLKSGVKEFGCSTCGRLFARKYNLLEHRYGHTHEPALCDKCGRGFKAIRFLKIHYTKVHSERCNRPVQAQSRRNVKVDAEEIGNFFELHLTQEKRQFVCESCNQNFLTYNLLTKHRKSHRKTVDKPFKCTCGKAYSTNKYLAYHKKVHSSIRFYCPKCFDGFVTKSKLKNHMSRHSHLRPYTCGICDKKYKTKNYTYSHLRRVHAVTKEVAKTFIIRKEISAAKSISCSDDGYNGNRDLSVISTSSTLFQLESSCRQYSLDLESERLSEASMGASTYRTDSSLGDTLDSMSIGNSFEDDSISVADSMLDYMSENSMFVSRVSTDDDSTFVSASTVVYMSQNSLFLGDSTKDDSISNSIYHVFSEDTTRIESEENDRSPVVDPSDICCDVTSLTNSSSSAPTTGVGEPQLQTQKNVLSLPGFNDCNSMLNHEEMMALEDELTNSQLYETGVKYSTFKKQIIQPDPKSHELSGSKDEISSNEGHNLLYADRKKESDEEESGEECTEKIQHMVEPEDSFLNAKEDEESPNEDNATENCEYNPNAEIKEEPLDEESLNEDNATENYEYNPNAEIKEEPLDEEYLNEGNTTENSEYNPNTEIKKEPLDEESDEESEEQSEEPSDETPEESSEEPEKQVEINKRVEKTKENGEFSKKEKRSLIKIEVKQEIPDTDMTPIVLEQHAEWSETRYREIYLGDIASHDCDCDPLIEYGSLRQLNFRQKTAFVFCL